MAPPTTPVAPPGSPWGAGMPFNPWMMLGMSMLGGNQGETGNVAFSNAMASGVDSLMAMQRGQYLSNLLLQNEQTNQQARERLAEAERHNRQLETLARERLALQRETAAQPSARMQTMQELLRLTPEERSAYLDVSRQAREAGLFGTAGTNINIGQQPISAGEAEKYSQTEALISNLEDIEGLLSSKDVDLSGFSGLWAEAKGQPNVVGATIRAVSPEDEKTDRAVRLAKLAEQQIARRLSRGDISDAERAALTQATGLIGGADSLQAVKDLLSQLRSTYQTQRRMRKQAPSETEFQGYRFLGFEESE